MGDHDCPWKREANRIRPKLLERADRIKELEALIQKQVCGRKRCYRCDWAYAALAKKDV